MAEYRFLTAWLIDGDPIDVWNAIYEVERWPEWWRGVERVERLAAGDDNGVGQAFRNRWRSVLPYTVEFDVTIRRADPPSLIELDADGELAGEGRWRMFHAGAVAITYEWHVRTTRAWMNALAPFAGPAFKWNHNAIMRRGGEGLAGRVGGALLAAS
jgi:hypothetical protein